MAHVHVVERESDQHGELVWTAADFMAQRFGAFTGVNGSGIVVATQRGKRSSESESQLHFPHVSLVVRRKRIQELERAREVLYGLGVGDTGDCLCTGLLVRVDGVCDQPCSGPMLGHHLGLVGDALWELLQQNCRHPLVEAMFEELPEGGYAPLEHMAH